MEPVEVLAQPPESAPDVFAPPARRVPNLLHFLLFAALTVFSLVVAEGILLLCAHGPLLDRLQNTRLQLGAELLGYLITLAVAWFAFAAIWNRPFLSGISWNFAAVKPRLIVLGFALGFASQAVESLLPVPKHAPIEDLFRNSSLIWFLAIFGTTLAPLFEEIVFRGFLLSGIAHAVDFLRLPKDLAALDAWRARTGYSRPALITGAVITSLLFAAIHAPQIGFSWSALTLLAGVSLVLCYIRLRYDSVAASTLIHACYNLSVFITIFVGTSGFRHLDRAG